MNEMKVSIWLLCLIIGGSTAFMCNDRACDKSPLEELARLEYRPKRSDLLRLCPSILDFFDCYFKGFNCFGMDVIEIAKSGDGLASVVADSLLKARDLAVLMCDKNSTLRKDYLENVECLERLVNEGPGVCQGKGELYAEAFLRQRRNLNEDHVDWEELDCLERVYGLACFVEQVEITCGEVARRTFLTILEKVKNAAFAECEVEEPLSLKRSFFEYLKLGGVKSQLYWYVFETFKRR